MRNLRELNFDILRGLAIAIMVAAHLADHLLRGPQPTWFVFLGALAAPLFIFLAGMMVALSFVYKNYPFSYYLKRGLVIFGIAVLVDIAIWQAYPLVSFDVLYLIAVSIPLTYLFLRLNLSLQMVVIAGLFFATPFLQNMFITDFSPSIVGDASVQGEYTGALAHFFLGGWFPIFPWLPVAFLGALLGTFHRRFFNDLPKGRSAIAFLSFFFISASSAYFLKDVIVEGNYFRDLMYIPSLVYITWALSSVGLLFILVQRAQLFFVGQALSLLGRVALFIYVFHLVIISYIFESFFSNRLSGIELTALYLTFVIFLIACAYGIFKIKERRSALANNRLFRALFGS